MIVRLEFRVYVGPDPTHYVFRIIETSSVPSSLQLDVPAPGGSARLAPYETYYDATPPNATDHVFAVLFRGYMVNDRERADEFIKHLRSFNGWSITPVGLAAATPKGSDEKSAASASS